MRMLGLLVGALTLAVASVSPGGAVPLPFNPTATQVVWNNSFVPAGVEFVATGNATYDASNPLQRTLTLPVTNVDRSNVDRTRVLHNNSGVQVTVPTSLTGIPPVTFTLSNWNFVFDNTAVNNNVISAIVSGPTIPTPTRIQVANFDPLATVPGVFFMPLHPETRALLTAIFPGAGIPDPFIVGGFTLVPVPAALALFATFGLALIGATSLRRREPMRLAA